MDYKQKFDEVINILNIAFHDNADILYHMEGGAPGRRGPEYKPLHWDTHKDHPDINHLFERFYTNIVYMGNTLWWGEYDDEVVEDDGVSDNTRYFLDDTCIDWKDGTKFRSWWWKQGECGGGHNAGQRAALCSGEYTPEQ